MINRWEIGSEFDWSNDMIMQSALKNLLPEPYELFSTGTAALLSIKDLYNQNQEQRLRLHLPSFYCMELAAKLQKVFDLFWYRDLPNQEYPDFNSINFLPGDLVLAVNLFGIRQGKVWQDWLLQHEDIILIEDHSHDPFSDWARHSTAHYAMASLRKTLPIPDGAIIWSPQKMKLPKASFLDSPGAYKRLTSMLLKRAYLQGANISKDIYRRLDIEGHEELSDETNCAVSIFTSQIISCLNISKFRYQREANIRHFLDLVSTEFPANIVPLFNSWPSGTVPFNSILICQTQEIRDALRKYLISQNIFPAIHWQQPKQGLASNDTLAIDLSNRILTIPTDHRYSFDDLARVATKITAFFKKYDNIYPLDIANLEKHISSTEPSFSGL